MDAPVLGATDHYGRAELVTVGRRDGEPALLDRRRVELIDPDLPVAPYHHEALELELAVATELVERVRASVARCALAALLEVKDAFGPRALVLPASPHERLPDSLAEILASRPLTNAADGMMYREALATAAAELGLEVVRTPRKADPREAAAAALGLDLAAVDALVAGFGREAGAPWRKDHKLAAAAALSVLYAELES